MIAKLTKGRGFRGALEYDLSEEKGRILDTNMAGRNPKELAAEFGTIRQLRPTLGKAVLHVALAAAPGDRLTDGQWVSIGQRYLQGMGFTENQYVITRHTDTDNEHIHILANRITYSGEVVSDSQDYRRQESLMREIERDYGLQAVEPSRVAKRRAPTKGEIEQGIRTGQPSTRQQLQQLCDAAAKDCHSYTDYQARLETVGVSLIPVVQLGGAKMSGISYRLDGVTMKGSDLGKGYTASGIQKRGITYEQDRDLAAVRRSIEREARHAFGEPDRRGEESQAEQRGGIGGDAGAAGTGDGRVDGRNTPDTGRDSAAEPETGRTVPAPVAGIDAGLQTGSRTGAASRRQPEQGRAADGVAALPHRGLDGDSYGGARDRILALSEAADRDKSPGPESRSGLSRTRRDRSLEAVQKQIAALGVTCFEIGIRDAKNGQMMNREWSTDDVVQSLPWLKRMNARGNHIYIRPAGEHGLVMVDDLKPEKLAQMKAEGFAPAATIETSPGNYQAWVKLSDSPVTAETRQLIARELAKRYAGDLNSADSRHYGRLAGFTNRKPEHERAGKHPYVLAHECTGRTAIKAADTLAKADEHLDKASASKERQRRLRAIGEVTQIGRSGSGQSDPVRVYQSQAQRLMQRYGAQADYSRMDWMIACDMAQSGRFTRQDIERGIRESSPNIESRKSGHMEDYARRTVARAWEAPEVKADRQAQQERDAAQNRQRDRGHSR